MGEKKLTGYPSIDKPWLKYYREEAINAVLPTCTIFDYLYENNKGHYNRTALSYFSCKISYGKLFESIEKAARALKQNGVNESGIVTVLMPALPEAVYLFYALSKIGAIANMVDPRTSPEGIRDYVQEVGSELLVVIDAVLPKVNEILSQTAVKKVLVISPVDSLPTPLAVMYRLKSHNRIQFNSDYVNWKSFIAEGMSYAGNANTKYEKDRVVAIVHTGGTTGKPKGVMLTNDNLNASAYQARLSGINMKREHSWLNIMPPFIAYGVGNGLHLPLSIGMETILIPQFDPQKFDRLLLKYRPNHMTGVPSHYSNIIHSKRMKRESLSYVIAPTVGGDTMDISLEKETNIFFQSHGCKYLVAKGYGMTEVTAGVTICISNECNQIGSVGIPLTHTTVAIFNPETDDELPYNQQGEICMTGPNTMLGYYKNPTATNEIIRKHKDGLNWVHSGDIGYMTEDGMLFIVDRIKRMIVRHDGFKVFPSMIEEVLYRHGSVVSCCVVGRTDKEHSQGKLPIAYIVLTPKSLEQKNVIKQQLMALCQKELPEYAQPVDYIFLTSLPHTPIGKVDFKALENAATEPK